ncbi:MAG: hypothetical protein ACPL7R_05385 [Anaerolineae bacterium]
MERKGILMGVVFLVAALVLAGAVGLSLAQGPVEDDDVLPQGEVGVATSLDDVIPIQGRLLDANGNPINGTRTIVMTLYDAVTGGTALCTDSDNVTAVNGLFNAYMDSCTAADLNGQQVWLGIKVGSDAEMTPRQRIYAVPYAWSLRPGAVISETSSSAVLNVFNYGTGRGLDVYSAGSGLSGPAIKAAAGGASGIALHADATSTDSSVVIHNRGTGPLLKGFGGDGGEDEIRINNDGSIETKADSYIFVPGTAATMNGTTSDLVMRYWGMGSVTLFPSTAGQKIIQFGIPLPGVLYGQPVKVEEVTVFYMTSDSASYIDATQVTRQNATTYTYYTLVDNGTDRKSTTWTSYSVTPVANNTLSAAEGFVSVQLTLRFADTAHTITIGGVRVRLGHHHLY